MNKNVMPDSLGVFTQADQAYLCYHLDQDSKDFFRINSSLDGFYFEPLHPKAQITKTDGKLENVTQCRDFRISYLKKKKQYCLIYRKLRSKNQKLQSAFSTDLVNWKQGSPIPATSPSGVVMVNAGFPNPYLLYHGHRSIRLDYSRNLKDWKHYPKKIFQPPTKGTFVNISNLFSTKSGWVLLFTLAKKEKYFFRYCLEALLFNQKKPQKSVWDKSQTVWKQSVEWLNRDILPVGTAFINNELVSYWQSKDDKLFALSHPYFDTLLEQTQPKRIFFHPVVKRFKENPLIKPLAKHGWESKYVFNPAAVNLAGKIHLVYRAVGDQNVSTLGYAASKDGVDFDERHKKPIYYPREPFETVAKIPKSARSLFKYMSGPGCGGCEDPRITRIDGRLYLTYNAWNGYEPAKVALSSIDENDFLNHRWRWKKPVLISTPNPSEVKNPDRINKNWVIFPEKIMGKYAILHGLSPNIQIEYFDSLDFDGQTYILDTRREWKPRENRWDTFIRGIGPPPMKTKYGWLLIYHAATIDCGYKVGALLLDKTDPTKILSRSKGPILEPKAQYETEGFKPYVVYTCGAVIKDNQLIVYYGGADNHICAATASLDKFIQNIKTFGSSKLEPISGKIN